MKLTKIGNRMRVECANGLILELTSETRPESQADNGIPLRVVEVRVVRSTSSRAFSSASNKLSEDFQILSILRHVDRLSDRVCLDHGDFRFGRMDVDGSDAPEAICPSCRSEARRRRHLLPTETDSLDSEES
jgi:hypothetical protein